MTRCNVGRCTLAAWGTGRSPHPTSPELWTLVRGFVLSRGGVQMSRMPGWFGFALGLLVLLAILWLLGITVHVG